MVHSFEYQATAKGGASLLFMENGKQRRIVFAPKSTELLAFRAACIEHNHPVTDDQWQLLIKSMRAKGWRFKSNPNNVSVYRPIMAVATATL